MDDPAALQAICDRLVPEHIDALLHKWLAHLPYPFTAADRAADYRYEISISASRVLPDPDARRPGVRADLL